MVTSGLLWQYRFVRPGGNSDGKWVSLLPTIERISSVWGNWMGNCSRLLNAALSSTRPAGSAAGSERNPFPEMSRCVRPAGRAGSEANELSVAERCVRCGGSDGSAVSSFSDTLRFSSVRNSPRQSGKVPRFCRLRLSVVRPSAIAIRICDRAACRFTTCDGGLPERAQCSRRDSIVGDAGAYPLPGRRRALVGACGPGSCSARDLKVSGAGGLAGAARSSVSGGGADGIASENESRRGIMVYPELEGAKRLKTTANR